LEITGGIFHDSHQIITLINAAAKPSATSHAPMVIAVIAVDGLTPHATKPCSS